MSDDTLAGWDAMDGAMLVAPPPLANAVAPVQAVDAARCIVDAVICTDAVDHQGDVVEPAGADLRCHKDCPSVFYHHGIGIGGPDAPGYILPVGKADDGTGNYGVRLAGNILLASTKFSQSTAFASQVFALYAEGILRGFSVNALPVEWERIADREMPGGGRKRCFRYTRWILKEYSATGLPVNPEALTISVQKGMVAGEPMLPILKAALRPYCLAGSAHSRGIGPVVLPDATAAPATPTMGASEADTPEVRRGATMTVRKAKDDSNMAGAAIGGGVGALAGGPVGAAVGGALGSRLADDTRGERPEDDPKKKPNPGGEEEEGDEDTEADAKKAEDLKPGERGMIDAHQMIRDQRLENAHKHHLTDDPDAMAAHEAIDDHLAKAEEIAGDYMESKGHERPKPVDFEAVKGMCKAGINGNPAQGQSLLSQAVGGGVTESNSETVKYKGIRYRGPRFRSVLKAATADEPKLTPAEARMLEIKLSRMEKRLNGSR